MNNEELVKCEDCSVKLEPIDTYKLPTLYYDCLCENCYHKLLKQRPDLDTYPGNK